jgi:hypothetical protein
VPQNGSSDVLPCLSGGSVVSEGGCDSHRGCLLMKVL